MKPLLSVENLAISFGQGQDKVNAVRDLSFEIARGETVAIVGESGSGKSVTALAIMALLRQAGGEISGGSIRFDDHIDMVQAEESAARAIRGSEIGMIFQEPMTSLNPVFTIGDQLIEPLVTHRGAARREAKERALEAMAEVKIPEPERRFSQFPHELSGGMRQRVMIAMALICSPKLLIADEPTTALDVTIQAQILWLIDRLKSERQTSVLFITHDLAVVAQIADRVIVMARGDFIEAGPVERVFRAPKAPYTQSLLAAVPRLGTESGRREKHQDPLLKIEDLTVRYPIKSGLLRRVKSDVLAIDQVSLEIPAGETLGLVGESGCGKSTIAKAILGLETPSGGRILVNGADVLSLDPSARRAFQRSTGIVFQDPFAALSPRRTAFQQISEPMVIHNTGTPAQIRERVRWLIRRVGLEDRQLERYPYEFSGGQRQRLCIARALALEPSLVIADEPVSALDVSVQAQVLDLFAELQGELGLTYLFISHDLAIVEKISDRIAVMHMGRVVEGGATPEVLGRPQHDYTRNLLSAVPVPDPGVHLKEPHLYRKGRQSPIVARSAQKPAAPTYRFESKNHFVLLEEQLSG